MRFYFITILTLLLGTAAVGQSNVVKAITAQQADTLIKNHLNSSDFEVVDLRSSGEFNSERIEQSRNLDFMITTAFNDSIEKLNRNKIYLVYCSTGSRSPGACARMQSRGFKTVYYIQGGMNSWKKENLPTIKGSATGVDNYLMINSMIVKIYPNPVVDLSTLEIAGFLEGEVKIEILNALGSMVLSQKMLPGRAITLNGRDLSPGLYFYRLVLPQNQVKSGRFQVAR